MEIHINVGSYEGKVSGFAATTELSKFDTLYSFASSTVLNFPHPRGPSRICSDMVSTCMWVDSRKS